MIGNSAVQRRVRSMTPASLLARAYLSQNDEIDMVYERLIADNLMDAQLTNLALEFRYSVR